MRFEIRYFFLEIGLSPKKEFPISNLIIYFRCPWACACTSIQCMQQYVRVRAMEYFTGKPIYICKFFYNVTYIYMNSIRNFLMGGGGGGRGGVPSRANNRIFPEPLTREK